MIDMQGIDWAKGPSGGIYLMGHDTSRSQVASGGGGMLRSQKIKGWDGGRFVPGDVKTSAEAIKATGLGWMVDQRPILKVEPVYGVPTEENPSGIIGWEPQKTDVAISRGKRKQENKLPTGGYDIAEAHVMNVRQDTGKVLGVVGPGWRSPQNDQVFAFMDDLVDSGDAKWLGGGEVDGGKRIWLACQFDRKALIGGDENELSVPLGFISNGWDGTLSLSITVAPYRMACLNGQTIPLEGYVRTWKGRHTAGLTAEKRLLVARQTLELSIGYFDAWTEAMEKLITAKLTEKKVEEAIRLILPDPVAPKGKTIGDRVLKNVDAKREQVLTIYRDTDNLQHLGHSKYRVFNAVTQYADWGIESSIDKQILRSAEASKIKDAAYQILVHA